MVKLSEEYGARGLVILGFPCNQFLSQEPRGPKAIAEFVRGKGFVEPSMILMEKVNVSDGLTGRVDQVYSFLKKKTNTSISWNFGTYYLISKTGDVQGFPGAKPSSLGGAVESLLAE
mmetsp:Transcript_118378/g.307518  ORF Transcript_118378/g.307518 Transcript_118378/m.307518 type:complete len:117 (-) Transcript_118378:334-684(-)